MATFAKTLSWRASPEPSSATFAAYHGETVEFRPVASNVVFSTIYYQTNGMGQAWWQTDGLVFHPTNDIGAAAYRFFVAGHDATGRDWRANGLLRMLDSPGFEPSVLQPPVKSIDFEKVVATNAPWLLPDATNTVLAAATDYTDESCRVFAQNTLQASKRYTDTAAQAATNYTDSAIAAAGSVTPSMVTNIVNAIAPAIESYSMSDWSTNITIVSESLNVTPRIVSEFVQQGGLVVRKQRFAGWDIGLGSELIDDLDWLAASVEDAAQSATNYTDSAVAVLGEAVGPAVEAYPRVYSFMTGSTNANVVVTNYQLTAEADAGRIHFDPADPDLDFSTVPSSLRIDDFSTGAARVVVDARDWTVWYLAQKLPPAMASAFTNAVEACRAWAGFTATGLENPVPDTLVVDVPNIWLMAGKTFEKHVAGSNSCWVIRSKDTVAPVSDSAQSAGGFLELTDAFGEPYMRFNKTESYFVDPGADGISFSDGAWHILYATQTKPHGGANAVIEGSPSYPGKAILKNEEDPDCPATITWTGSSGAWTMNAVPKLVNGEVPDKMFFGAVVEVEGQDYIEYLRPMSIPHLLVNGVKIAPNVSSNATVGTTVTWKVVQ